jgi:hypothetical protein
MAFIKISNLILGNVNKKILEATNNQLICSRKLLISVILIFVQIFNNRTMSIYLETYLTILEMSHSLNTMFQDAITHLNNAYLKKNIYLLFLICKLFLKLFNFRWILINIPQILCSNSKNRFFLLCLLHL